MEASGGLGYSEGHCQLSLNLRIIAMKAVFALLLSAFVLAGCGQKGDLYLPDSAAPAHNSATTGSST